MPIRPSRKGRPDFYGKVNDRLCAKRNPSPGEKVAREAGQKRNSGDNPICGTSADLLMRNVLLRLFPRTKSNISARIPLQSKSFRGASR